jgi:hypothetical protein
VSPEQVTDRICFPGRREALLGGCGQNLLFCTPRKTNFDPFVVRVTTHLVHELGLIDTAS